MARPCVSATATATAISMLHDVTADDVIATHRAELRCSYMLYESITKFKVFRGARARARAYRAERSGATVWRVYANFTVCDITLHCWRFTSFLLEESWRAETTDECTHARTLVRTHARMHADSLLVAEKTTKDKMSPIPSSLTRVRSNRSYARLSVCRA